MGGELPTFREGGEVVEIGTGGEEGAGGLGRSGEDRRRGCRGGGTAVEGRNEPRVQDHDVHDNEGVRVVNHTLPVPGSNPTYHPHPRLESAVASRYDLYPLFQSILPIL
eukprot:768349-Hanusia_phi.AAC.6